MYGEKKGGSAKACRKLSTLLQCKSILRCTQTNERVRCFVSESLSRYLTSGRPYPFNPSCPLPLPGKRSIHELNRQPCSFEQLTGFLLLWFADVALI